MPPLQLPRTGSAVNSQISYPQPHFGSSKPTEQNQDQQDNDYEAEAAATVVAGPIEWTASKPTKTSEQDNDQDD